MTNECITIITREQLRAWGACYSDERIAALVPASGLTPLEILDLNIPAEDRRWVVLRGSVIPVRELRLLACLWAERALDSLAPEHVDPRSREAIRVARGYADGQANTEDLVIARENARAAWAAACAKTAENAAYEAATPSAADAARVAVRAASGDAVDAAVDASATAEDAAEDADEIILEDVRRVLSQVKELFENSSCKV